MQEQIQSHCTLLTTKTVNRRQFALDVPYESIQINIS